MSFKAEYMRKTTMKKIFLITLLMIVFLLNGCASDSTETQIESYDTQETLQVNKKEFGSITKLMGFRIPHIINSAHINEF